MRRKFMLITLAVICLFVCILTKSLFTVTEEDEALYSAYQKQSYLSNIPTVSSIVYSVNRMSEDAEDSYEVVLPGVIDASNWLEVCDLVHKEWGRVGAVYNQGPVELNLWGDSNPVRVFTDCSGYVGYCLYCYNRVTPDNVVNGDLTHPVHSCTGWDKDGSCGHYADATNYGAICLLPGGNFNVKKDLIAGDILWYSGHVEVFHSYPSLVGKPYVYNWGGAASAQGIYKNVDESNIQAVKSYSRSAHSLNDVKAVWRLQ